MNVYETHDLTALLAANSYPGRGIVLGNTADGKQSVAAYFIMGRSENSRNRIFVKEPDGLRTEAYDPAKLADPSLIIYHPFVRWDGDSLSPTGPDGHHPVLPGTGPSHGAGAADPGIEPDGPAGPPHFRTALPGRQL